MKVQIVIEKTKYPIEVELTEDGKSANCIWQGGKKWIKTIPLGFQSGEYDKMVFEAREFNNQYNIGDLVDATPTAQKKDSK